MIHGLGWFAGPFRVCGVLFSCQLGDENLLFALILNSPREIFLALTNHFSLLSYFLTVAHIRFKVAF